MSRCYSETHRPWNIICYVHIKARPNGSAVMFTMQNNSNYHAQTPRCFHLGTCFGNRRLWTKFSVYEFFIVHDILNWRYFFLSKIWTCMHSSGEKAFWFCFFLQTLDIPQICNVWVLRTLSLNCLFTLGFKPISIYFMSGLST